MSQSATLYRVEKNNFDAIVKNGHRESSLQIQAHAETFDGTHEGLCFVLAKCGNCQLVEHIFYPKNFIGSEVDYNNMDEAAVDALSERIYYLSGEEVITIQRFLQTISPDDFKQHFDAAELNKEDVYPWTWNDRKEADAAYNEKHILDDFKKLCSLFEAAAANNEYILCYVG